MSCNPCWNPYTEQEKDLIRAGWDDNLSDVELQGLLLRSGFRRSTDSIKSQRCRMHLRNEAWAKRKKAAAREKPSRRISSDVAFKRAMLAAIKAGTEHAVVGVVKDCRPWALKRMQPEPVASGCSSPESWV